ncbi:pilus assembly protein PilP [Ferrimonas gelatinilytica]|uniref:Pilus assembly protein PilP n=1 Tax=Ferrimonas gelatinilytica TaxID=1255257 RepID=A0ABP9SBX2_9GAMM
MKRHICIYFGLLLTGCGGGMGDLRQYVAEVEATPVPFNEVTTPAPRIVSVPYEVADLRSPFRYQKVEVDERGLGDEPNCPKPDLKRMKTPLEAYAVDSFMLKGVMKEQDKSWALLQSGDGAVHKVDRGDFIGLFHGQVKHIGPSAMVVEEWIPDAKGCWHTRDTQLAMASK